MAALIGIREGREVVGVTVRIADASVEAAEEVARRLGIDHRVVEARDIFRRCVVRDFVEGWARGLTPNPCVECNPRVKFRLLSETADALDCPAIITGHYARVRREGEEWHLLRGLDPSRDQSYMLYRLPQAILARLVLPVGGLGKGEVRTLAEEAGLPAADRPDSQDVCFAPDGDLAAIIARHRPEAVEPGPIVTADGRELGRHRGLAGYTVGQRRGLGIGGPEGPWFVLRIDPDRNALVVGDEAELWVQRAEVKRLHVIGDVPERAFEASVMTRYRGAETPATVERRGERATIRFEEPHRAPAPGQSAVFYDGERCMGGGVIV